MTSHPPPLNRENFRAYPRAKMAANLEMEALRLQNDALKAENARLKATRAAIYKLHIESEGCTTRTFSRTKVFEALQLSADEEEVRELCVHALDRDRVVEDAVRAAHVCAARAAALDPVQEVEAHAEQHALDLLRGAQPPIVIVCEVVHDLTRRNGDVHEPSHEANGCLYIS